MLNRDITGRDSNIVAKALAYAILSIDQLPKDRRELIDQEDMKAILKFLRPNQHEHILKEANSHLTGEDFKFIADGEDTSPDTGFIKDAKFISEGEDKNPAGFILTVGGTVEVVIKDKVHRGSWVIKDDLITVTTAGGATASTQYGAEPAENLARDLLKQIASRG